MTGTWQFFIKEGIKAKIKKNLYLRQIMLVFFIHKDNYKYA